MSNMYQNLPCFFDSDFTFGQKIYLLGDIEDLGYFRGLLEIDKIGRLCLEQIPAELISEDTSDDKR